MGTNDLDEHEPRVNGSTIPPVPETATHEELIEAVNNMAAAVRALVRQGRTHAVELGGIRNAYQAMGTRIETACERLEAAITMVLKPPPRDT